MERILAGLEPQDVLYWFEEICKYPHGTYHEKPLSDYLVKFAQERGFAVRQDESWNLAIEVPATPGYEECPKVILQAHIDMVCKKEEGSDFNFETDPLEIYVDNGWIRAKGTSLGADNCGAVAIIMAIMDSKTIKHPPMQVLLTVIEEVACTGAGRMDYTWPDGEYLINMDLFRDDAIMMSCAGISIHDIDWPVERVALPAGKVAFDISFSGLKGGHSGEEIHEGRANAIAVLAEVLYVMRDRFGCDVIHMSGDGLFNVISSVSRARICCDEAQKNEVREALTELLGQIRLAYHDAEPNMVTDVTMQSIDGPVECLAPELVDKVLNMLYVAPVNMNMPFNTPCTLACSSSNFGSFGEVDGVLRLVMSIRSNPEYRHDQVYNKYRILCGLTGAKLTTHRRILSWEYNPDSPLRDLARQVYEMQNGQSPEIIVVHSGVEVATFLAKLKEQGRTADAIAMGYNILDAHSTGEAMEITSLAKTYRWLVGVLEAMEGIKNAETQKKMQEEWEEQV